MFWNLLRQSKCTPNLILLYLLLFVLSKHTIKSIKINQKKIFDATHAEGKKSALLFQLGSTAVIPGLNDIVSYMQVGEKVQAIIPPELAFGDEGICLEGGECLIKPGSTLVYDVLLKKTSIPPP